MNYNLLSKIFYNIQASLPVVDDRILSLVFCLSASCIAFAIGYKLGDKLFEPLYSILFHLYVIVILAVFLLKF